MKACPTGRAFLCPNVKIHPIHCISAMLPYLWDIKQTENMNNQPANTEVQVAGDVIIYLAKHAECGWYVETSDKYVSDYYATKKEAAARRSEIKNEIKKGWW